MLSAAGSLGNSIGRKRNEPNRREGRAIGRTWRGSASRLSTESRQSRQAGYVAVMSSGLFLCGVTLHHVDPGISSRVIDFLRMRARGVRGNIPRP